MTPPRFGRCEHCGSEFAGSGPAGAAHDLCPHCGFIAPAAPRIARPVASAVLPRVAVPILEPDPVLASPQPLPPADAAMNAMAEWLTAKGYTVGGKWQKPFSTAASVANSAVSAAVTFAVKTVFRMAVGPVSPIVSRQMPGMTTWSSDKKMQEAVEPLLTIGDLLAVRLVHLYESQLNRIVVGLKADDLRPRDMLARFADMLAPALAVANCGVRVNDTPSPIQVVPLAVYTDPRWFDRDARELLARGWRELPGKPVVLRAGVIDLTGKRVRWAEAPDRGRWRWLDKKSPFDRDDIWEMITPKPPTPTTPATTQPPKGAKPSGG